MVRVSMTAIAGILLASSISLAEVKSGPAVGKSVGAFNPTHVTGPDAGKSTCLV